jgi:hypothetical protein
VRIYNIMLRLGIKFTITPFHDSLLSSEVSALATTPRDREEGVGTHVQIWDARRVCVAVRFVSAPAGCPWAAGRADARAAHCMASCGRAYCCHDEMIREPSLSGEDNHFAGLAVQHSQEMGRAY